MQPYPWSPDLVWPDHLHGTGCLIARAMDTRFPVVWRLCLGWGCAWARASAAPRHTWLGCWGLCVLVCVLLLHPATPSWAAGDCVCLCACSSCTPPLLAGVCGVGVRAWARVTAAPRHSWLGCWGVCVLVCALRLYPATPDWGVRRGGVCLSSGFGCALPLLAGVLGCACLCACLCVPRHFCLGRAA